MSLTLATIQYGYLVLYRVPVSFPSVTYLDWSPQSAVLVPPHAATLRRHERRSCYHSIWIFCIVSGSGLIPQCYVPRLKPSECRVSSSSCSRLILLGLPSLLFSSMSSSSMSRRERLRLRFRMFVEVSTWIKAQMNKNKLRFAHVVQSVAKP